MANEANIKAVITAEDKASSTLKNVAESTSSSFLKMAGAVAAGQLALQAVEKVGGDLLNFFKSSITATEDLVSSTLKLERNFGFTAEQASGLLAVFDRFGLSADDASRSFGIFQKHLLDVQDSESIGIKAISVLGVTVKDSAGHLRSMNDVLLDIADKFKSGVVPATERAGVAMQLFGRSGQAMIPVLLQGSDGIKELEAHAKSMGVVLSQDNVAAVLKNIQAQKTLNEAITGVKLQIGNALIPEITKVINKITDWIEKNGGIEKIMNEKVIPVLKQVITSVENFIKSVDWVKVVKAFENIGKAVIIAGEVIGAVITGVNAEMNFFHNTVAGVIYSVVKIFQDYYTSVYNIFAAIPGAIQKGLSGVWNAIVSPFQQAFNVIRSLVNDVINAINQIPDAINNVSKNVSNAGKTILDPLNLIGHRASGGSVSANTPYLVGEQGAELFVPNGSGTIIPNNKLGQTSNAQTSPSIVNININAGALMGTDVEARKFAKTIITHMKDMAASRNQSVQDMLGA